MANIRRGTAPRVIGAVLVATLALASGASAEQHQATGKAASDDPILVVTARDLVDRSVRNSAGARLGEVRFVLLTLEGAEIRAVAVRPDDPSDEKLVIVPWGAIDVNRSNEELRITAQTAQVMNAPRFARDELAELTRPVKWVSVSEYWAPIAKDVAAGGGQQKSDEAGQQSAEGQEPSDDAAAVPHILVGRSVVTTVSGPEFNFADQLRGSEVVGKDGKPVGEIDDIVIDPRRGRVAFAVIVEGGFLGFGRQWYPVPLASLTWSGEQGRLRLQADAAKLRETKALDASRAPMRIERSQLETLYQRFGATPYWKG